MNRLGYLVGSESGKGIYEKIQGLPIIDLHTHVDPREIMENERWRDIWELEGATDHYVWELMRRCGIPEELISGHAPNKEKWLALAKVLPLFAGNPVYDWVHLDLRKRFGIQEWVSSKTAERIWNETKEILSEERLRPKQVLRAMNVEILCTTDSPSSALRWHEKLRNTFPEVRILPTWRPDAAMNIGAESWGRFVDQLAERTGQDVADLVGFLSALEATHRYFDEHGCVASDHALESPWGHRVSESTAAKIYQKARSGKTVSDADQRDFQAFLLHFFGELNAEVDWLMQLHIGAIRNYRESLFAQLGSDSGGDVASHSIEIARPLRDFLNTFDQRLRIVLYGLHAAHLYTFGILARAFPNIYLGAPWWFLDNPYHTSWYLKQTAAVDLLSRHAGMVSDSRKLISFGSRFEMFRRVLTDVLGAMVEQGRMPLEVANDIANMVAYNNPKSLVKKGPPS